MNSSIALAVFVTFFSGTIVVGNAINQLIMSTSIAQDQPLAETSEPVLNKQFESYKKDFETNTKWRVISDSEKPFAVNRTKYAKRSLVVTDIPLLQKSSEYYQESNIPQGGNVTWHESQDSRTEGLNFEDNSEMELVVNNTEKRVFTHFDTKDKQYTNLVPYTCQKVELVLDSTWSNSYITDDNYKITNITTTRCPNLKN
jgi:hypothetical protein